MSTSNIKDILSSRRRMVAAAAWMLVLVVALSAATYAWFSNSRYTNVTPVAHTVSDESSDLQIGLSANGPWDTTATLAVADKTLYPISTADLSRFWRGTFQNAAGITTDYADCTAQLDDYALSGTLYLKGGDSALNVYLYPAIWGRWVMQMTWWLPAMRLSFSDTICAVRPLIPVSISSNISVGISSVSARTALIASMILDSSPPEATAPRGRGGSPGFVEIKNSASSNPPAV